MQNHGNPICIAGMHRSGTSLVANLARLCGVYFGPEADFMPAKPDNPEGFFENVGIVELNERLLSDAGGGWDHVPACLQQGAQQWNKDLDCRLRDHANEALELIQALAKNDHPAWGWKDPRNSLTFGFWKALLPNLKVVICLRHPVEVAVSLHRRNGFSYSRGLHLWQAYYQHLLASVVRQDRIITHYAGYLRDCQSELRRLQRFFGIEVTDEIVTRCCKAASPFLRHTTFSRSDLESLRVGEDVCELYDVLCTEAGWLEPSDAGSGKEHNGATVPGRGNDRGQSMRELDKRALDVVLLQKQVEERTRWAQNALAQVAQRDDRIRALQSQVEDYKRHAELTEFLAKQSVQLEELTTKVETLAGQTAKLDDVVDHLSTLRSDLLGVESEVAHIGERFVRALDRNPLEVALRQCLADMPKKVEYKRLAERVQKAVEVTVPGRSTVLVLSKGDSRLVRFRDRLGWHFPQDAFGEYSGFAPADSGSAIIQLEALRARGADYLVFPATAMWWLEHYAGLREYLDRRYRLLAHHDDTCTIYALRESGGQTPRSVWVAFEEFLAEVERRFERVPTLLDWGTSLNLAGKFSSRVVFSPPSDTPPDCQPVLPYLDGTVDVVAVASADDLVISEASRVAAVAVVTFCGGTAEQDSSSIPTFQVQWLSEPQAKPLPSASIIIPSYNGIALTEACIRALQETLPRDFCGEIIVVDDSSSDDTAERMRRLANQDSRIVSVRNAENLGFVGTCNRGAQLATGDILIFLNNDTLPQPGWLEPLLKIFETHGDAGAVGGKLVYPDGRVQEAGGIVFSDGSAANLGRGDYEVDAPLYNYVREVDYVTGALIATPRALFESLGGLDLRYKPIYYEETDYCFRVRQAGLKVYYQPASTVIHLEGVTCGTDPSSGQKRYQLLNRQKFVERWSAALRHQPENPNHFDALTWYGLAVREERKLAEGRPAEQNGNIIGCDELHQGNGHREQCV